MSFELWSLLVSGLSSAAAILIVIFAIRQAESSKTQAETSKIQAEAAKTQAEAEKIQTDIMQQEIDANLRPWIGASQGLVINDEQDRLVFRYKNYGQLPALSVTERFGIGHELFTKESVQDHTLHAHHRSSVLPTQEGHFRFSVAPWLLHEAINGKIPLYAWIVIDYTFGKDVHGEYGIIEEYRPTIGAFIIKDEWVM